MKKKNPAPSPALIKAYAELLVAKAYLAVIKPKVKAIHAEVIAKYKPVDEDGELVDYDNLYNAEDEISKIIYNEAEASIRAKTSYLNGKAEGLCPILCAESDIRDIEHRIIELADKDFKLGITLNNLLRGDYVSGKGFKNHIKFFELVGGLVVTYCNENNIDLGVA